MYHLQLFSWAWFACFLLWPASRLKLFLSAVLLLPVLSQVHQTYSGSTSIALAVPTHLLTLTGPEHQAIRQSHDCECSSTITEFPNDSSQLFLPPLIVLV
ncbi:hypothetical protein DFH09DRAFT_1182372, partial [Mycena vulgaris]